MNFGDAMNDAGRPRGWREAVQAIRAAMPGRGQASRYLANKYGVSLRTAQKWLQGSQAPDERGGRRRAVGKDSAAARKIAADAMRNARAIAVGRIKVNSKSKGAPEGTRNVGVVAIDPATRKDLQQAAALYESGMVREAEQKVSDAILGGYGAARGGNPETARGALEVSDYPGGINFV